MILKYLSMTGVQDIAMQHNMSRLVGKPTICIGENKDADQLRGFTAKLISAFVFATRIVQFLFYLNLKFQAYSSFLCLYRPVCVGPVRKPHCWFSPRGGSYSHIRSTQYFLGICYVSSKLHLLKVKASKLSASG